MYAQMIIGEVIGADCSVIREFQSLYKEEIEPELMRQPGCISPALLVEEGGRLVVVFTIWGSREGCLRYAGSDAYRQFVSKSRHLLVGDYVVKLFRME
jgi:quinol monooxygenase YgiN